MVGIYLCARKHRIPGYDIIYNDIIDYPGIDIVGDCLNVNFEFYDYIIATPPCNYYSRANYRRESSKVALDTKHLLPKIIERCLIAGKPFIIENVQNKSLLPSLNKCYWFEFGQHLFYTNVLFNINDLVAVSQNKQHVCRNKRDGNDNVDIVIKRFLQTIHELAD